MSSILYYSQYCESSNKILSTLSKFNIADNVHFICIDKRVQKNGKIYVILQNGQEMLLPENITKVPALMILNQQYRIIYGNEIINFFQGSMQTQVNQATKNNTVPASVPSNEGFLGGFSFGGFGGSGSGIVSDNYSFLDQDDTELKTTGNGGLRQMHNYALLDESNVRFNTPNDESTSNKIKDGQYTLDQLKQAREQELQKYAPRR